jgi:tungstate transport system permease protein
MDGNGSSLEFLFAGVIQAVDLIIRMDPYVVSVTKVQLMVSGLAVILSAFTAIALASAISFSEFRGKDLLKTIINTSMGLPPVAVGLVVFLFLTRNGPIGFLDLIYTPAAMIIAQYILATPIITGISISAIEGIPKKIWDTAYTLGGTKLDVSLQVLKEARLGIITAILAGFGRAIAEVGAILTVGGNIVHQLYQGGVLQDVSYTRTLTTAITVETRQGNIPEAIAFGIILLILSFFVNFIAMWVKKRAVR